MSKKTNKPVNLSHELLVPLRTVLHRLADKVAHFEASFLKKKKSCTKYNLWTNFMYHRFSKTKVAQTQFNHNLVVHRDQVRLPLSLRLCLAGPLERLAQLGLRVPPLFHLGGSHLLGQQLHPLDILLAHHLGHHVPVQVGQGVGCVPLEHGHDGKGWEFNI